MNLLQYKKKYNALLYYAWGVTLKKKAVSYGQAFRNLKFITIPKPTRMRNFKGPKIWQAGLEIAVNCFKLAFSFPKEERY